MLKNKNKKKREKVDIVANIVVIFFAVLNYFLFIGF